MEPLGCSAEMQLFCDRNEIPEVAKFDCTTSVVQKIQSDHHK
jgi:hypothetical protein